MDANEYQDAAQRTAGSLPTGGLNNRSQELVWGSLALCGEAGELAEHIKKGVFHQQGINMDVVEKELGDVLWYVADIATKCGLSLGGIMEGNIAKLKGRYPEGFDSKLAPKKERFIVVSRNDGSYGVYDKENKVYRVDTYMQSYEAEHEAAFLNRRYNDK